MYYNPHRLTFLRRFAHQYPDRPGTALAELEYSLTGEFRTPPPRMTFWRAIQLATGLHRIHHIAYSYGYKLPLLPVGFFPASEFQGYRTPARLRILRDGQVSPTEKGPLYHNCTLTGRY